MEELKKRARGGEIRMRDRILGGTGHIKLHGGCALTASAWRAPETAPELLRLLSGTNETILDVFGGGMSIEGNLF